MEEARLDYYSFANSGSYFTSQAFRQREHVCLHQLTKAIAPWPLGQRDDDWQGLDENYTWSRGMTVGALSKENLGKLWAGSGAPFGACRLGNSSL